MPGRNTCDRDFPGGSVAKTSHSQCREPWYNPSVRQWARFCMPQLKKKKKNKEKRKKDTLRAATKTWHSPINKYTLKKKKKKCLWQRHVASCLQSTQWGALVWSLGKYKFVAVGCMKELLFWKMEKSRFKVILLMPSSTVYKCHSCDCHPIFTSEFMF